MGLIMGLTVTGMVAEIEKAFSHEWALAKPDIPLPEAGKEDRDLLFTAIARGVLQYVSDQQASLTHRITLTEGSLSMSFDVSDLTLNITIDK